MVSAHGATAVSADEVASADVDIYCPCALGATINDESVTVLKASIVCGSANNQLAEPRHGDDLHRRGRTEPNTVEELLEISAKPVHAQPEVKEPIWQRVS